MAKQFALDLKRFARKCGENADIAVEKIVTDIGQRIVERSPVGNPSLWKGSAPIGYVGGRFRANWQHGYNAIPQGVRDAVDATGAVSILAIAAGARRGAGGIHYLVNNLPYAQKIEKGHSTQAPTGIVGLTVVEFETVVRNALRSMK